METLEMKRLESSRLILRKFTLDDSVVYSIIKDEL